MTPPTAVASQVASHHGYNYTLAVYGAQQHQPAINATFRELVSGIRQLEPRRVARVETTRSR